MLDFFFTGNISSNIQWLIHEANTAAYLHVYSQTLD